MFCWKIQYCTSEPFPSMAILKFRHCAPQGCRSTNVSAPTTFASFKCLCSHECHQHLNEGPLALESGNENIYPYPPASKKAARSHSSASSLRMMQQHHISMYFHDQWRQYSILVPLAPEWKRYCILTPLAPRSVNRNILWHRSPLKHQHNDIAF